jgi:hypothetical protein
MVGAGLKPAPTTGWKPAQPVQLTCGLEARAPRASIVQTDPRAASAAHLRAGSPRTQGIDSTNRSAHSQCSSPAGWKPARPGHLSNTMVGAGLKPAPTTGWKPAQPVQLTCGLEARAPRASIVQTDPHEPVQLTCGLEARAPRAHR